MAKSNKPKKPYPSFPLTAHPNGQWCKTIRYKLHYFGPWSDPDGALKQYQAVAADLHAGRQPKPSVPAGGLTIKDVANAYLDSQHEKARAGAISKRWWNDQRLILERFAAHLGKQRLADDLGPLDFEKYRRHLALKLGVYAITHAVTVIRSMFKYAVGSGLLDRTPNFGPVFRNPTKGEVRKARARQTQERGLKMFTPEDLRRILELCEAESLPVLRYLNTATMKACILLGINGGFINSDCAGLPRSVVDLDKATIDFPRPKTGIQRYVTLWPETVAALRSAMNEHRTAPIGRENVGLALTTRDGKPVAKEYITESADGTIKNVSQDKYLSEDFRAILQHLGLHRKGIGFSALRPTFRTLADEVHDDNAARLVMGHEIPGMDGIYIQRIGVDRVRAVTDHVRSKVFI